MKRHKMLILDLCGGTAAWSRPYAEAGYDVRNITLPEYDVRTYIPPKDVHGVLAAPPCQMFSLAGNPARFKEKQEGTYEGKIKDALAIVDACLRIVVVAGPVWWALENPVGTLSKWLGKPRLIFNPCDYGDPYTKKTCLWGDFNIPVRNPVEPEFVVYKSGKRDSKIHYETLHLPAEERRKIRAITPPGFARAFFEANP